MKSYRRELFVYSGQDCIGRIIVEDGQTTAFDGARKSLGEFPNQKSALAAINTASRSKCAARKGDGRDAKTPPVGAPLNLIDAGRS